MAAGVVELSGMYFVPTLCLPMVKCHGNLRLFKMLTSTFPFSALFTSLFLFYFVVHLAIKYIFCLKYIKNNFSWVVCSFFVFVFCNRCKKQKQSKDNGFICTAQNNLSPLVTCQQHFAYCAGLYKTHGSEQQAKGCMCPLAAVLRSVLFSDKYQITRWPNTAPSINRIHTVLSQIHP